MDSRYVDVSSVCFAPLAKCYVVFMLTVSISLLFKEGLNEQLTG